MRNFFLNQQLGKWKKNLSVEPLRDTQKNKHTRIRHTHTFHMQEWFRSHSLRYEKKFLKKVCVICRAIKGIEDESSSSSSPSISVNVFYLFQIFLFVDKIYSFFFVQLLNKMCIVVVVVSDLNEKNQFNKFK